MRVWGCEGMCECVRVLGVGVRGCDGECEAVWVGGCDADGGCKLECERV